MYAYSQMEYIADNRFYVEYTIGYIDTYRKHVEIVVVEMDIGIDGNGK